MRERLNDKKPILIKGKMITAREEVIYFPKVFVLSCVCVIPCTFWYLYACMCNYFANEGGLMNIYENVGT